MQHWNSENFDPIGYSYKPVTPDVQSMLEAHWGKEEKPFDKDVAKSQTERQIFLGLLGFKHHKRFDVKRVFQQIEDAGIRPVLFSKEDMLKTKTVGADLGMDTDFNAWISLKDDDHGRINRDGKEVLPSGVDGIKRHLKEIDKIPLQVQMFCDVDARTTEQMFQIYQEEGDIVACIGNILNTENMSIFQQSNVAIGMRLAPLFRCHRCNGRVNCIRKSDREANQYTPSKLE